MILSINWSGVEICFTPRCRFECWKKNPSTLPETEGISGNPNKYSGLAFTSQKGQKLVPGVRCFSKIAPQVNDGMKGSVVFGKGGEV